MKALVYLTYRSFVNNALAILKSPKRLIPIILVALALVPMVVFGLVMSLIGAYSRWPMSPLISSLRIEAIWSGVFALVVLIMIWSVRSALSDGSLVFPLAHIDFLFPTPVERRNILILKLVGDAVKIVLGSAWVFVFIAPMLYSSIGIRPYPTMLVAWAASVCLIVFVANTTHTVNIVTHYGAGRLLLASRLTKLCVIGILLVVALTFGFHYARGANAFSALVGAFAGGVARYIVLPAAWMADIALAPAIGVKAYGLWQLLWLAALAVGSGAVLLTRRENFYEPSLNVSMRTAKVRAAMRSGVSGLAALRAEAMRRKGGTRYASSPIPPFGRGAGALIWKDLVTLVRVSKGALVGLIIIPIAAAIVGAFAPERKIVEFMPIVLTYMVMFFVMPGVMQLAVELGQANITKAMPVSGFSVMAAYAFSRWVKFLSFMVVSSVSIRLFIPGINPNLLWTVTATCCTLGLSGTAAMGVAVLLYPNSRAKMQLLIPNMVGMALFGAVAAPSVVITVVALIFKVAGPLTAVALVVVNACLTLAALTISGRQFRRLDPTSD